jgi:hypothetical protein
MSNIGVQYGLYEQSRSLASLIDRVLLERRQNLLTSPEQRRLGVSLQRIMTGGVPELAWRVIALKLRNNHRDFNRVRASIVPQALLQGDANPDVIPFLEYLSSLIETEQVQAIARIRS